MRHDDEAAADETMRLRRAQNIRHPCHMDRHDRRRGVVEFDQDAVPDGKPSETPRAAEASEP